MNSSASAPAPTSSPTPNTVSSDASQTASPSPTAKNTTPKQPKKAKKANTDKKGRAGAPNYSKKDVDALLDIVEEVEPIGANLWALVANKFELWSTANERPARDSTSLKNKFDKLCNAQKKTGDPSCPPNVRRAKHIARDIQGKIAAAVLSAEEDSEDVYEDNDEDEHNQGTESSTIGTKERKRDIGMGGLPSKKARTEDAIVEKVDTMTTFNGMIAKSMQSANDPGVVAASQEQMITKAVKQEVKEFKDEVNQRMGDTKAMLAGMNEVLQQLVCKLSGDDLKHKPQ